MPLRKSAKLLCRYFSDKKLILAPLFCPMNGVVKLSKKRPIFSEQVKSAAESLLAGKVIALPTDTIYGIAALAQNIKATEHIYTIKKRNKVKPIAICVSDIAEIYSWGKVTVPYNLLYSLLPGPVTLIFERTPELNPGLNPDTNLIGIRIPNHDFILNVTELCNSPLALTSANISQDISPLNIEEFKSLWPSLDTIYDSGQIGDSWECRAGSTIIDLSIKDCYKVIRHGSAFESTIRVLQEFNLELIE